MSIGRKARSRSPILPLLAVEHDPSLRSKEQTAVAPTGEQLKVMTGEEDRSATCAAFIELAQKVLG